MTFNMLAQGQERKRPQTGQDGELEEGYISGLDKSVTVFELASNTFIEIIINTSYLRYFPFLSFKNKTAGYFASKRWVYSRTAQNCNLVQANFGEVMGKSGEQRRKSLFYRGREWVGLLQSEDPLESTGSCNYSGFSLAGLFQVRVEKEMFLPPDGIVKQNGLAVSTFILPLGSAIDNQCWEAPAGLLSPF